VVLSQFLAAFCALGMAPFFSVIVKRLLHEGTLDLAVANIFTVGVLFHFPAFCGALVSPFWGRLADVLGRKKLLLRAQLGLIFSFIIAGYSTHLWHFVLALLLQGISGGTYAASRAYLASQLSKAQLADTLTLMEGAPRLAWFVAPAFIGWALPATHPVTLYRVLLFLPLIALLMTSLLPEKPHGRAGAPSDLIQQPILKQLSRSSQCDSLGEIPWFLFGVQFLLGFASGMVTPYFIDFLVHKHSTLGFVGWVFGIPNLVYLILAAPLSRIAKNGFKRVGPVRLIQFAFFLQAVSLFGQGFSSGVLGLIFWRTIMGFSLTFNLIGLHEWISRTKNMNGERLGWLDSISRLSALLGGILAGVGLARYSIQFPFYLAAILFASGGAVLGLGGMFSKGLRNHHVEEFAC
jgi:MFS family permease